MSELALIASRDHDAMARFYDRHVAMVGQFCAALCPNDRVDEAVTGVFLNFLARAAEAPQEAESDELLRRATREVAASRMETQPATADEQDDPVCRVMPELLAARVNGELTGREGPIVDHLSRCAVCQSTAARLGQAEIMFPVGSPGEVTGGRAAWLRLAGNQSEDTEALPLDAQMPWLDAEASEPAASPAGTPAQPSDAAAPAPDTGAREEAQPNEPAARPAGADAPDSVSGQPVYSKPAQPQVQVRVRRGGLVAAVRRFATSQGYGESGDSRRDN